MRLVDQEPKTILLVEDSPDDERLAIRALKQAPWPLNLDVVRDGVEALDYFFGKGGIAEEKAPKAPILVLLDLKLPKVTGLEVLRKLRENPNTRTIPVVVLTLSDEEKDIAEAYSLGANSYIRKPVNFDQFMDIIGQLSVYWFSVHSHPTSV